ncbi:MAG: hypothetical protein MUD08_02165 [Cytophagales bacterium]|nr:hypothetical protein [Cytophagales bacterium]
MLRLLMLVLKTVLCLIGFFVILAVASWVELFGPKDTRGEPYSTNL